MSSLACNNTIEEDELLDIPRRYFSKFSSFWESLRVTTGYNGEIATSF
jgi:hypothetical protein